MWYDGGGGGAVLLISRHEIFIGFISLFCICLFRCVCGFVLRFAQYSRKTKYYFFELEFKARKQKHGREEYCVFVCGGVCVRRERERLQSPMMQTREERLGN